MLVAVKSHEEKNVFQNVNPWVKTLNPKTGNALNEEWGWQCDNNLLFQPHEE